MFRVRVVGIITAVIQVIFEFCLSDVLSAEAEMNAEADVIGTCFDVGARSEHSLNRTIPAIGMTIDRIEQSP